MARVMAAGAEATVEEGDFLGRPAARKIRRVKTYRHPVLDQRLRDERTRDEASLLLRCRKAGVPVPVLYDVDRNGAVLAMERIEGRSLKDVLTVDDDATATRRMHHLGGLVARMHDAGATHGDLTTSNVLVPDDERPLVLIDFGLGQLTQEDEPRGVDLHLVEEALEATDPRAEVLMAAFLEGYGVAACAPGALGRLDDIRQRGRYREAV